MDRSAMIAELKNKYNAFTDFIGGLSEDDFLFSLNGEKWSAGQQIDHLCLSVKPLNRALSAPAFTLKAMFGKADHPSMSYDELVARYRAELAAGGTATAAFRPEVIPFSRKNELVNTLTELVSKLCSKIEKYDESELDVLVLPHPLLGKLTFREMFYFTIYHAEHHLQHSKQNLAARPAQGS
ncbi:MAG: DinB family protein [Pyrinomonadaceae bacterium]|nr:DinB family protein [Acidobacteriota bacterium]MBP7375542.1 DinB family protein [Pyrinomonadaceae bacterium]